MRSASSASHIILVAVAFILNAKSGTTAEIRPLVPSLFVFGDSFVDSGNNNQLNTTAKCNHPPYGVNFDSCTATGRWSDGLLITDYIASYLGLPYPPNFLEEQGGGNFTTGANFASASSGILNETGIGRIRTFEQQIQDFGALKSRLDQIFGYLESFWRISQSLFYINIGTNDIANLFRATNQQVPLQFQNFLLQLLQQQILKLYDWGARKIVVVSAAIVGCPPLEKQQGPCAALGEASAQSYNTALQSLLQNLTMSHVGLSLVYANLHDIMTEVIQDPSSHGFVNAVQPCCPRINNLSWCRSTDEYCSNPSQYMFWDIAHPSNAFNKLAAERFWNGSLVHVFPLNIRQLASVW